MEEGLREALEAIEEAKRALPPPGPIVLSEEYLAAVERIEAHEKNRPGTDKSWVWRCLSEWYAFVRRCQQQSSRDHLP